MENVGIFLKSGFGNLGFGVGALKVLISCLDHHKIKITKLIGSSAGSFAIPSFAIRRFEDVHKAWFNLQSEKVSNLVWQHPFRGTSILSPAKLKKYVKSYIETNTDEIFSPKAIPFEIITTNLVTGDGVYFANIPANKHQLLEICMASAAIVPFFPPVTLVKVDDLILVDGGFSDDLPIKRFVDAGCDMVFVVDLYNGLPSFDAHPKKRIWPEFLMRTIQISLAQHSRLRLDLSNKINRELEVLERRKIDGGIRSELGIDGFSRCVVKFVNPVIPMNHISFRRFDKDDKQKLPEIGYWAAKTVMQKLGLDFDGV